MEVLITLFFWGFIVCLSIFVFQFVLSIIVLIISGIAVALATAWRAIFGGRND